MDAGPPSPIPPTFSPYQAPGTDIITRALGGEHL